MKIYTRRGDQGETDLFGGPRVGKDSLRIETCGEVDELNAVLGWACAEEPPHDVGDLLRSVQQDLFAMGAELASPDPVARGTRTLALARVEELERAIDGFQERVSPLTHFILPGGSRPAACLHVARAVCRRAERRLVSLDHAAPGQISPVLIAYLNRLSDLLFVLARFCNHSAGVPETLWKRSQ